MKVALDINSLQFDFICGDHFAPSCFEPTGKLRAGSLPTFFPRRECLKHDHNYVKDCGQEEEEIGNCSIITVPQEHDNLITKVWKTIL